MANIYRHLPSLQAHRPQALAAAFALVMVATWQPALVCAQQVDVEVLTTPTVTSSSPTTAPVAAVAVGTDSTGSDAESAAGKIVPAPGTVLQSTENSSLGGKDTVAPAPSLQFKQDQVVMQAGSTTETMAINSGAELLKMLGVQKKASKPEGGLELEEDTTNTLFDTSAVERLKGEKPTVVYRVVVEDKALPDPMIVPWIRQAKLLQERFDLAVAMLGNNQVEKGREELMAIATDFPESDYAIQSRELIKKLDDMNRQEVPQPVIKPAEEETTVTVELNPNIQIGTVIVDPGDPSGNRVMINGSTYKAGDNIRNAPNHRLLTISENAVQIEVEQSGLKKTFDVPVRPTGTTNK